MSTTPQQTTPQQTTPQIGFDSPNPNNQSSQSCGFPITAHLPSSEPEQQQQQFPPIVVSPSDISFAQASSYDTEGNFTYAPANQNQVEPYKPSFIEGYTPATPDVDPDLKVNLEKYVSDKSQTIFTEKFYKTQSEKLINQTTKALNAIYKKKQTTMKVLYDDILTNINKLLFFP